MKLKQKKIKKESVLFDWVLKTIDLCRIFLGNYANVSESRPICYLIKLYCIFFSSSIVAIYYCDIFDRDLLLIDFVSIIEYILTALIFFIYGNKPFKHFLCAIKTNDRIVGFKKLSLISNYVYLFIFFNTLMRIVLGIYNTIFTINTIQGYCSILFLFLSVDFNNYEIILLFSTIQSRMKQLRNFLSLNSVPINIVGRNEVAISIKNVRKSLLYYNNLLDEFQSLYDQMQYLLIINWISHSVRVALTSYFLMMHYNDIYFPEPLKVMWIVGTIQSLAITSSPAFIVEATAHEVDQIKETLTKQLLRCSDGSLRFELETALQYVSLRPFRYRICRAVPLNIYLPFTVTSLCITYVIVAMQLTHFTEDKGFEVNFVL